jgi:hypothetical protein
MWMIVAHSLTWYHSSRLASLSACRNSVLDSGHWRSFRSMQFSHYSLVVQDCYRSNLGSKSGPNWARVWLPPACVRPPDSGPDAAAPAQDRRLHPGRRRSSLGSMPPLHLTAISASGRLIWHPLHRALLLFIVARWSSMVPTMRALPPTCASTCAVFIFGGVLCGDVPCPPRPIAPVAPVPPTPPVIADASEANRIVAKTADDAVFDVYDQ